MAGEGSEVSVKSNSYQLVALSGCCKSRIRVIILVLSKLQLPVICCTYRKGKNTTSAFIIRCTRGRRVGDVKCVCDVLRAQSISWAAAVVRSVKHRSNVSGTELHVKTIGMSGQVRVVN